MPIIIEVPEVPLAAESHAFSSLKRGRAWTFLIKTLYAQQQK
jgi:hypothetical protein